MSILSTFITIDDGTSTSTERPAPGESWEGYVVVDIIDADYHRVPVYIAEAQARTLAGQIYAALLPSDDATLARRLEWATGTNGEALLGHLRAEGLDVVAITPEHAETAEGATA